MHFAFTEEQDVLRDVLATVLQEHCSPAAVRAAGASCEDHIPRLRSVLGEMGLLTLAISEDAGGQGLGLLDCSIVLDELGYAGAPGPWIDELAVQLPGWPGDDAAKLDRGATACAAFLCGLARRMLDLAVEYVRTREQFGRPIGGFQAVQHHLADARLALDFSYPLVWRAAWCLDHADTQVSLASSMAKHHAAEAARLVARKSLQCHGAMGYAHEYDLQLFMKRTWRLAPRFGDAHFHRRRVAKLLDL